MRFTFLALIILGAYGLAAQDTSRFRNFHGLVNPQNGDHFFEAEGYDISIQLLDNGIDEKGIAKIKKKYGIKNTPMTTDSLTELNVLSGTKQVSGITAYYSFYLIPETEKKTTVIGFVKPGRRDVTLEHDFINAHITNKIPDDVYTKAAIDSIDFVGRTIQLGPACRWMGPHNIQCPDQGQMNWAIFDDQKQAEEYRDLHLAMTKSKNLIDVKEEKLVNVKFEGQETKALRTTVKVQLPKFAMGGSNLLVVYYVTAYVRGKYVTCILSQYTNDAASDQLARLLTEVLELIPE